jgi:hypothetical protein
MADHAYCPKTEGISDQFKQTLTASGTFMNRMVSQEAARDDLAARLCQVRVQITMA